MDFFRNGVLPLILMAVAFVNAPADGQVKRWVREANHLSNLEFEKVIQPDLPACDLSGLDQWNVDDAVTGKMVYQRIVEWDRFVQPARTGIIVKYLLRLSGDSTVPYFVYVPKGYSARRPSKLMVYYKGGWLSRKEFPHNVGKEIVVDNPTFTYLDQQNTIQIFPALKQDLAIYGAHGYKHLRMMITATKRLYNIDDNRVYLSGFSDGGRTVGNIAFLAPTPFAAFYTINGTINSPNVNFPNFAARSQLSFLAEKDTLTFYKYPVSIADTSRRWGGDWTIRLMKGKGHFYFPYAKQILPTLFEHMNSHSRRCFPNQITFHKSYNYEEFSGVDWLDFRVDTDRQPSPWHHVSDVTIHSKKGKSEVSRYGDKTGQVIASYFNNTFEIKTSMVQQVDISISPLMVDLNHPVRVVINGEEVFNGTVKYSKQHLINQFKLHFDRKQVWVERLTFVVK